MSDESSRSARPYGQRRNDGAPSWWAALDRGDLPDNEGVPAAHRRWYEEASVSRLEIAGGAPAAPTHRGWLIALLVAVAVAAVLAMTYFIDQEVFFVALLIGIPVGLAATVTIVMARRSG